MFSKAIASDIPFEEMCSSESVRIPVITEKFASKNCPNFDFLKKCVKYKGFFFNSDQELKTKIKKIDKFVVESYKSCQKSCENNDAGACAIIGEAYFYGGFIPFGSFKSPDAQAFYSSYSWYEKACQLGETYSCTQLPQISLRFWMPWNADQIIQYKCEVNEDGTYSSRRCFHILERQKFAIQHQLELESPMRLLAQACELEHANSCVQLIKLSQKYPQELWDDFEAQTYIDNACEFGSKLICNQAKKYGF